MKAYLAPDIVLRLLINPDDANETKRIFADEEVTLVLSDFALYEALHSCTAEELLEQGFVSRLIEICRRCEFFESGIPDIGLKCTEDRKAHLRNIAMGREGQGYQYDM